MSEAGKNSRQNEVPERTREDLFSEVKRVGKIGLWCLTVGLSTFCTIAVIGVNDHFLLQKHSDEIAELKHTTENTPADHEAVAYMRPKVERLWWTSPYWKKENE
ncbi:hypothetical protein BH09VER1_BH09VER1_49000 [soil metagenome]